MSYRLVECASRFELGPAGRRDAVQKLVLLCLAHNAKDTDRRAYPGTDVLKAWTGRGHTKIAAAITALEAVELIVRTKYAAPNVRAEWIVLPAGGCCTSHQPIAFTRVEPKAFRRGGTKKAGTVPPFEETVPPFGPNGSTPCGSPSEVTPRETSEDVGGCRDLPLTHQDDVDAFAFVSSSSSPSAVAGFDLEPIATSA